MGRHKTEIQASSTITDTLYNGFSSITDFWLKPLARQGVFVHFSTLYNGSGPFLGRVRYSEYRFLSVKHICNTAISKGFYEKGAQEGHRCTFRAAQCPSVGVGRRSGGLSPLKTPPTVGRCSIILIISFLISRMSVACRNFLLILIVLASGVYAYTWNTLHSVSAQVIESHFVNNLVSVIN